MNRLVVGLSFAATVVGLMPPWMACSAQTAIAQDAGTTAEPADSKEIDKTLDIPPRRQWDDNEGYCGETCIQSVALYYGGYISQYRARAMVHTDQQHELVVSENEEQVLTNLRLAYETWNYKKERAPQWKNYLAWAKRHLNAGHPVIATVYMKGEDDPDFDHILPFIGFRSSHDTSDYHDDDLMIFCDNYAQNPFGRSFQSLCAARWEVRNGSNIYYIPRQVDYGVAVTGIVDRNHETAPIQLSVDRWDEPNLVRGQRPATMQGTLTIRSLTAGKHYSLLRYDDYRAVPKSDFLAKKSYRSRHRFRASASTQTFTHTFMSDQCVIYRCVAD